MIKSLIYMNNVEDPGAEGIYAGTFRFPYLINIVFMWHFS